MSLTAEENLLLNLPRNWDQIEKLIINCFRNMTQEEQQELFNGFSEDVQERLANNSLTEATAEKYINLLSKLYKLKLQLDNDPDSRQELKSAKAQEMQYQNERTQELFAELSRGGIDEKELKELLPELIFNDTPRTN